MLIDFTLGNPKKVIQRGEPGGVTRLIKLGRPLQGNPHRIVALFFLRDPLTKNRSFPWCPFQRAFKRVRQDTPIQRAIEAISTLRGWFELAVGALYCPLW